jgi:NAD-dependent SIR2 family protein deacetylase
MMLQDFMSHERHRRRYWARSLTGFRRMSAARPNAAHHSLARLERSGKVELLVTQNVDGLHQAAGHHNVIDLHGRIDVVRCLRCAARLPRAVVQNDLIRRNPGFAGLAGAARPDGDSDVGDVDVSDFAVPDCPACGGILKPDVVFFGESVPRERVRLAMAALSRADAMLVVGSSLMVYSGYRFAREMAGRGRPIAALGLGRTRADDLLTLKVTACCTETLAAVVSE